LIKGYTKKNARKNEKIWKGKKDKIFKNTNEMKYILRDKLSFTMVKLRDL